MDFTLNDDQVAVMTGVESMASAYRQMPVGSRTFHLYSSEFDDELMASGFLDIGADPDLGTLTAAIATAALCGLPHTAEIAASSIVRPNVCPQAPRPLALLEGTARPARFLMQAKSAVLLDADGAAVLTLQPGDVEERPSLLAYPMGRLTSAGIARSRDLKKGVPGSTVRHWWRLALAVETAGLLRAALDATVQYVTERKQFGRPIGSFQAIQHRLAEDAVLTASVHWLALKAAHTGAVMDSALAAYLAQDAATRVAYDLHQFHGAMGMTLEHPLHLWTYRLKALLSELGGRGAQAEAAAEAAWRPVR